jgi:membrane-associated HD superfamily phosphohydrolase
MALRQMVQQLKDRYDDLCEEIENISLHIVGTQEDMEMALKEFMETVADKLEGMEKKICKAQDKVNRK